MISHRRAELLLAESIDFDLAAGAAREVAEHLAACPACAGYAAALRTDAERIRQMPPRHAPPRVRAALEQAARRPGRRTSGRVQLLLAAALLGLLLAAALFVGSRQRPDDLLPAWAAAPVGAGVAGATQARMQAVAWGEDGFVAVGATPLGPASWHSADGESWNRGDDTGLTPGLSVTDGWHMAPGTSRWGSPRAARLFASPRTGDGGAAASRQSSTALAARSRHTVTTSSL